MTYKNETRIKNNIRTANCLSIFRLFLNPSAADGWFDQYKILQDTWKINETMTHGYSSDNT